MTTTITRTAVRTLTRKGCGRCGGFGTYAAMSDAMTDHVNHCYAYGEGWDCMHMEMWGVCECTLRQRAMWVAYRLAQHAVYRVARVYAAREMVRDFPALKGAEVFGSTPVQDCIHYRAETLARKALRRFPH